MQRLGFGTLFLLVLVVVGFAIKSDPAIAHDNSERRSLGVHVRAGQGNAMQDVAGKTVMISLYREGRLIKQTEGIVGSTLENGSSIYWDVAPGTYTLRFEGEGLQTLEKKGFHVFANELCNVIGDIRPGRGLRSVEYTSGGPTLEEIAARLARVEQTVARLTR